jgi:hypothetical protein
MHQNKLTIGIESIVKYVLNTVKRSRMIRKLLMSSSEFLLSREYDELLLRGEQLGNCIRLGAHTWRSPHGKLADGLQQVAARDAD